MWTGYHPLNFDRQHAGSLAALAGRAIKERL
jgi:hypothetical protein